MCVGRFRPGRPLVLVGLGGLCWSSDDGMILGQGLPPRFASEAEEALDGA
jgi:hypothetical protein